MRGELAFFRRAVIVGVGLIGGSIGLALKRTGFGGRLVGVSRPATVARALELGAIDQGWSYDQLGQALKGADLVFICTPIKRILALIADIGQLAEPGTLVTDVGSTKRRIVAAAQAHFGAELYFVGGHPMAGSEKAGVDAADPFLFQNAIYILVPDPKVPADRYQALTALLRQVGARVMELDAGAHDRAVARDQPPAADDGDCAGEYGRALKCRAGPLAAAGRWRFPRLDADCFQPVRAGVGGYLRDQCRRDPRDDRPLQRRAGGCEGAAGSRGVAGGF